MTLQAPPLTEIDANSVPDNSAELIPEDQQNSSNDDSNDLFS